MAEINQALPAGTKLRSAEHVYTIESTLGQGGFGITYLASAVMYVGKIPFELKVAVKELFLSDISERRPGSTNISVMQSMTGRVAASRKDFIAEAKRLETVCTLGDNIVKVSEVFEANNTAYYVMEYLDGQSLAKYVKERGRLTADEAVALIGPIAQALKLLHDNKMTHLDVKPDNIMLSREKDGSLRPVLIDFGLAKHYDDKGNATSTVNVMGLSEGYAPLEQYVGITTFSPAADVYALAATLYHALTGHAPAKAGSVNFQSVAAELSAVNTPAKLSDLILRSLSPFPDQRPLLTAPLWRGDASSPLCALSEPLTGGGAPAACDSTATVLIASHKDWDALPPSDTHAADSNPSLLFTDRSEAGSLTPEAVLQGTEPLSFPSERNTTKSSQYSNSSSSPSYLWIAVVAVVFTIITFMCIYWPREDVSYVDRQSHSDFTPKIGHIQPRDFELCASIDGRAHFFTQDEWENVNDKNNWEIKGVFLSGQEEQFLVSLSDNKNMITWHDAMEMYGPTLPTQIQACIMAANYTELNEMIKAFGGDENPEWCYWTQDEYSNTDAINFGMHNGTVFHLNKSQTNRVRPVYPVPTECLSSGAM